MREIDPQDLKNCFTDVCLKGPYSPLETVVHNMMYASREKQVNIEWNSVNSVLLDTDPQEIHERLLIAADVGQNELSSKLTLRHTTLMPNIPGMPAIVALLFCPSAELRRSSDGTRYVSALCGLGSHVDGSPCFSEHDLLVNIDADLPVADIGRINHVRHLMDYAMYCDEGQTQPAAGRFTPEISFHIRKDIVELLGQRRKHREPESVPNAWEWQSVPEEELLEISVPEMVESAVVFPLHTPQELRDHTHHELLQLKKDNDELKLLVARTPMSSSSVEVACKLCGTRPMPTHAMRIHLYSNAHREKEDDFRIFET